MSKARSTGNLNNSILISDTGAITFVSGSTTLASLSTTGQLSGSAPVVFAATSSFANSFTVAGTLTAQTLVVQTITSSVSQITGSTSFGTLLSNTHVFSGSVTMNPGGLFVSSSGGVGVGTTNPYTHASVSGLVVAGTGGNRGIIEVWDNSATAGKAVFQNVGGVTYVGSLSSGSGAGTLSLLVGGDGSSATVAMSLLSNGNVGIGTNNPSLSKLQIVGDWDYNTTNNTQITIQGATNTNQMLRIGYSTTGDFGYIASLLSGTAYKPLAINPSGGNVGIRTTNPRTILQVTPVSNGETPVLGTATGAVTFTSANTNYGIQFNSTSDGTYFIQSQRFDSSATAYALGLNPVGGYVYLGKGWGASNHRINLEVSQGNGILVVSGYSGVNNDTAIFYAAGGANPNGAATALSVTTNSSTGRSINAGGTINASGADYAEYIEKTVTDIIAKGDIVGINSDAKLTNIFADAISFAVKSTDPSYVGGDVWGDAVGKRPSKTTDQTEEEFATILSEFETRLEAARVKVDRISFSGQVPCNVTGANVGDYIIPIELENGKIGGQAISNPTFEQYQISVGKVWKVMEDGRAWIAVKIG